MHVRKQRWVAWWLAGVVVAWLVGWWMEPREPSHENRSLTGWLDAMAQAVPGTAERAAAEDAFLAMGTNAVPALLREVAATEPRWWTWVRVRGLSSGSGRVTGSTVLWRRSMAAAQALRLLGEQGDPPVAAVKPLLRNPRRGLQAVVALAGMGEPGMLVLAPHARSTNTWQRLHAALGLGLTRPASPAVAELLFGLMQDPDVAVRGAAMRSLGKLGAAPERAVPQLLSVLDSGSSRDRESAVLALDLYGAAASNALPTLERVRDNPADELHEAARAAVEAIRGFTEAAAP